MVESWHKRIKTVFDEMTRNTSKGTNNYRKESREQELHEKCIKNPEQALKISRPRRNGGTEVGKKLLAIEKRCMEGTRTNAQTIEEMLKGKQGRFRRKACSLAQRYVTRERSTHLHVKQFLRGMYESSCRHSQCLRIPYKRKRFSTKKYLRGR